MSEQDIEFCIDRQIPLEYAQRAISQAVAENPANQKQPTNPFEAAAIHSKLWLPGRTLRICFLDGDPVVQERVRQIAQRWCQYAHIYMDFGDHVNAEIRISFRQRGSWSAIGTDALVGEYFKPHQPTMNFGWLRPETPLDEYQRVVLHEFGHALGLIHEHQSPSGGMNWDEDAVYCYYGGPPNNWDAQTIRHNILDRYEVAQTQFTAFDPHSIMLYSYPSELTMDRRATTMNMDLSVQDISFIARIYPPADAQVVNR
jgi:hypothetical protein